MNYITEEIRRLESKLTIKEGRIHFFLTKHDPDFEILMSIHGSDILSDNFRWKTIMDLLDRLHDYDLNTLRDLRNIDINHKIVESLIDNDSVVLTQWLASNSSRTTFCNDALVCGMVKRGDVLNIMKAGQYLEINMILNNIIDHLESLNCM